MSKIRRYGFKKSILILNLVFIIALGIAGISYGAWSERLDADVTLATAEFDPQIEVYKIERVREILGNPLPAETYTLSSPIRPVNGTITVRVGVLGAHIWIPAIRNDKYKIYYRVINNSSIPIDYSIIKQNLNGEQESYVEVSPDNWTRIEANSSIEENFAFIHIKYVPEIPEVKIGGIVIVPGSPEINPFGLPDLLELMQFDKTFALVRVKQFNAGDAAGGWTKNVGIRIITNGL